MSNKPTKRSMKAEAVVPSRPSSRFMVPACACSAVLAGAMLFGTVPVLNHSLAYADGYVDGTGNNIYYGYKTDASYTEARFHTEVTYYDTLDHAKAGTDEGKDPLGKFVRVHYLSNCNKEGGTADDWRFRPMWWYGVPKGLTNVQEITYTRIEKLTNQRGNQPFRPAGSSQFTFTDGNGYGVVSHKTYQTPKDWKGISNFYYDDQKILASKGWKQLLGIDGKQNKGYDNAGNTAGQWESYQAETDGLQGIFVDWESAGQRFYDMTYVGEMTDTAWKERHTNPLRFAAGVYRFAGNWHYAVGQKHNTPRIADHIDLKYPELTPVKDLNNVSTDEQKTIKDKIKDANKDTKYYSDLVDKVEVSDKGVATITFKDTTTRTISADLLVFKNEEDKDKYKPIMPTRTPVVKPSKLTEADKEAVIAAFKNANKDNKDFNGHLKAGDDAIKFNDDGTKLVVTYQDGSKLEINASELVCQGATIADWAPYAIPDTIEVDNLKHLSETEVNKIIAAFDTVNTGVKPYDEAKASKGNKAPLTVDANTGNVTITWKDGSHTTIPGWQYLKEKVKTPAPEPQPPVAAEKTFFVETPDRLYGVNFDPLNTKPDDLTNAVNRTKLDVLKDTLKAIKGKDSKNNSEVPITDVLYSVDGGKGYITFKAQGYKDRTYPMSVFFTKNVTPYNPSSSTVGPDSAGHTFIVKKYPIAGDTPTDAEKKAALKQFIETNWDNASVDGSSDSYTGGKNWKPKPGTSGIGTAAKDGSGITTISLGAGGDIVVKDNRGKTYNIVHDSLYEKNAVPKDTTIDDLKKQAKALLQKRTQDGLSDIDLMKSGIDNAATLNDPTSGIDSMNDAKKLRDLIRKLTDAKKAEYTYYTSPIEIDADPNASGFMATDDQVQAAVKAFLKANYTDTGAATTIDKYAITGNSGTFDNITWTPKAGTKNLEMKSATMPSGIDSFTLNYDDGKSINFMHDGKVLFNVPANKLYKKKPAPAPAPSGDEFNQMKKDAKQAIERNPNLTKEQKEQYKNEIDNAQTPEAIKKILDKAAQQGKANQNDPSKAQTITDNKGGGNAKKEAEEKKQKEEEKQKEQKLQDDKKKASEEIDNLNNLTPDEKKKLKDQINGGGTPGDSQGATTPEAVQKIVNNAQAINDAKGALQNDATKGALPFLDHGNAADDKKDQPSHADDAALNELLGTKPGLSQELKTLDDLLKKTNPAATADELNKAVTAAKQANASNEQKAKDAANKQLTEKKDALDNAYNALTDQQKQSAKDKYDSAIGAINTARDTVGKATTPSQIKKALDDLKTAIDAANEEINKVKDKRDTTGNTNDNADALTKEKKEQIDRINKSDLPEADKKKAIDDINAATKLGDPTGIADRALKAKKIADALAAIDKLEHLNDAQKKAYKDIINTTDAHNIKDDDGKETGKDDIDNALADAIATDTAMARLEKLKKTADDFSNGDTYKNFADQTKKDTFEAAYKAAKDVLDKAKGDAKGADEVNTIYNKLLKAMQVIDPSIKGAGVNTDALSKEIEADKGLKPDDNANPKTSGKPVYITASKDKKAAFDQALTEAEAALKTAEDENKEHEQPGKTPRTAEQEAAAQKAVDDALQKLEDARRALDGVDTKPLEKAIAAADPTHKTDKYKNADEDKQQAYDAAIEAGKQLLQQLAAGGGAGAGAGAGALTTKEQKQSALDAALKQINDTYAALNGHFSPGFRPWYPDDDMPEPAPQPGDTSTTPQGEPGDGGSGSAGSGAGTGDGSGIGAGAGTGADAGTDVGTGAGTGADVNVGAGAGAGVGADTGTGAGAVDADAIKNAVQTTADATAPRNPGAMTGAQSPESSAATDAHGKHIQLPKTADAAPLSAFALMMSATASVVGAGALRRKVKNARHSKR